MSYSSKEYYKSSTEINKGDNIIRRGESRLLSIQIIRMLSQYYAS